jgi:hypothetical protein
MRRCISLEWYFDKKAPKKCDDRYYPAIKWFPNAHPNYYDWITHRFYREVYAWLLDKYTEIDVPDLFVYHYSADVCSILWTWQK